MLQLLVSYFQHKWKSFEKNLRHRNEVNRWKHGHGLLVAFGRWFVAVVMGEVKNGKWTGVKWIQQTMLSTGGGKHSSTVGMRVGGVSNGNGGRNWVGWFVPNWRPSSSVEGKNRREKYHPDIENKKYNKITQFAIKKPN